MKSQIKNKNCGTATTNIKQKQEVSILTCFGGREKF